MSRIGRAPIAIPAGVEIKIEENNVVTVKGPKPRLHLFVNPVFFVTFYRIWWDEA